MPIGQTAAASGDAAKGKAVFEANCQFCHTAESNEAVVGPGLKDLYKWPPHKLSDGTEHATHTDEIIRKQIVEGGGAMQPAGGSLTEEEIADLLAYLKTI
ncbi:MAG TPA: cytochrome c [Terriglobia bacterium]|nr:cytochrome c [Terriglobia bacterium]